MTEAPSFEGASLVPATPPIGKAPGVGYSWRWGRGCRVAWEILPMGRRLLLRQNRTQPRTLDGDLRDFWVWWL